MGNGVLLGPDRRPVEKPVILDHNGDPIEHPYGDAALPHVFTFASIMQGADRTYYHDRFDEALRHGEESHLRMKHDQWLMGLLNERKLAVASLKWHLEVDDEKDPRQKQVKEGLTKICRSVPFLQKMLMSLLEAIWYGRYGVQFVWKWGNLPLPVAATPSLFPLAPTSLPAPSKSQKTRCLQVAKWIPVNGDKIGHNHDGVPHVLVNPSRLHDVPWGSEALIRTNKGQALQLRGSWRERFVIHRHEIEDADYWEADAAEAVHGLGIRSRIFWADWVKQEYLDWVVTYFERVGLGLTLWMYEAGNAAALTEAKQSAKDASRKANLFVPVVPGRTGHAIGGVERVETPTAGVEALRAMIEYLDYQTERYVIGQTMSSGSDNEGSLGGSGRAKFAENTKKQITRFDANNLAETLTGNDDAPGLVSVLKRWTYPWADFPVRWVFDVDDEEPDKVLEAVSKASAIGVDFKKNEVRALTGLSDPEPGDDTVGGQPADPNDPNGPGDPLAPDASSGQDEPEDWSDVFDGDEEPAVFQRDGGQ